MTAISEWRRISIVPHLALLAIGIASAVADAATSRASPDRAAVDVSEQWQKIDLQSPLRAASEVELLIQTDGPRITGLIRIPGAPASNFDTGSGKKVVDLINARDGADGYAEITAVEVLFTQTAPGQSFMVAPLGYDD